MSIKKGESLVILGLIDTVKSSLLRAIAGFMKRIESTENISDHWHFVVMVQHTNVRAKFLAQSMIRLNIRRLNVCAL